MKSLFDAARMQEVTGRIAKLTPDAHRQWGTMTASQAAAHCAIAMEVALGEQNPPRMLVGRFLGPIIKPLALGNDSPIRRNTPTAPIFVVTGDPELGSEQARWTRLTERFTTGGPAVCTTHPHVFFGRMTPEQWAVLMYEHSDHHLRQFGV